MAHHQKHYFDRTSTSLACSPTDMRPLQAPEIAEEDDVHDVDEPPERGLSFGRLPIRSPAFPDGDEQRQRLPLGDRKQSLLTQGLLTGSNLKSIDAHQANFPTRVKSTYSNASIASTAELTSDGDLTSPARTSTPSPPLSASHAGLIISPKILDDIEHKMFGEPACLLSSQGDVAPKPALTAMAEPQPRKHITFACSRPKEAKDTPAQSEKPKTSTPPKRKCALSFACPSRPKDTETTPKSSKSIRFTSSPPKNRLVIQTPTGQLRHQHRDSESTAQEASEENDTEQDKTYKSPTSSPELVRSEALRFHEFASAKPEEDEWISAKPTSRQKITVSDTLRKENVIRKLGEEAEEEALEEDEVDEENENLDEDDIEEIYRDSDDDFSDGNETDNEEGFADSDDESEDDPDYQFWTAATSTDHIRPKQHRTASESSIESIVNLGGLSIDRNSQRQDGRPRRGKKKAMPKMRPGTPELPDSTDFVCGTLDEDRPLEVAYLSCMEQRKKAKHIAIPQDVDPSFPTSDLDQDEDDDDVDNGSDATDGQTWNPTHFDESDDGQSRGRHDNGPRRHTKSPAPSPKRLRSPPPKRRKSPAPLALQRGALGRSPPPRLFTRSPKRCVSPSLRPLQSPPSSPKDALLIQGQPGAGIHNLAQRPNLTHTKSLPRTPNPFWYEHRKNQMRNSNAAAKESDLTSGSREIHSRGPIDIVQGLERKRQRCKEKFWRQHCRNAGKDKDRRVQPGKGAERMRELGLEMADRCRGYGQRTQLVLSI